MAGAVTTFLMFEGVAEEAMNFYVSLFNRSAVTRVERYAPGQGGKDGSVKMATFTLCGTKFMCSDTPVKHDFSFTPAISMFVDCDNEAELDDAFRRLSEGGAVLMPLDDYGFSRKFGWLNDRFGVSWQLNLPD